MTMLKKTALFATLPLLAGLWLTPLASAHDTYWRQRHHQPAWSHSTPYHHSYRHSWRYSHEDRGKYNKAMNRLSRQEREAQAKAYRKYDGNVHDPHYRQRLSKIDRRYDYKRDKVERNLND